MIIRRGQITSGQYAGWEISIDDDREGDTGGFYLFIESQQDSEGYDYWFENLEGVEKQISHEGLTVIWTHNEPA